MKFFKIEKTRSISFFHRFFFFLPIERRGKLNVGTKTYRESMAWLYRAQCFSLVYR